LIKIFQKNLPVHGENLQGSFLKKTCMVVFFSVSINVCCFVAAMVWITREKQKLPKEQKVAAKQTTPKGKLPDRGIKCKNCGHVHVGTLAYMSLNTPCFTEFGTFYAAHQMLVLPNFQKHKIVSVILLFKPENDNFRGSKKLFRGSKKYCAIKLDQ
jgi:hypothetical protein